MTSSVRDTELARAQLPDLIADGERHGLAPDVSREIYERVCQEATDRYRLTGRFDAHHARARFHEVAARAARFGGQLHRDPGKGPAVGMEHDSDTADAFGETVPGRGITLVELEQRRLAGFAGQQRGNAQAAASHRAPKEPVGAPGAQTLTQDRARPVAVETAAESLLVDNGPLAPGQMPKGEFLATLRTHVVAAVDQELGKLGATAGCPYIDRYFAKYDVQPAAMAESLIRHWIPAAKHIRQAMDLIPLVIARVADGVRTWNATKQLPPDLAAADPELAATIANPPAQGMSLDAMESRLGPGAAVDGAVAARASEAIGQDVSGARVHAGPAAAALAAEHDATAFAVGQNVVMGGNAPAAGTLGGDELLAHELAHTAQQKHAASDPAARKKPIGDEDQAAERDAGLARLGNFAGAIGDVMQTGLQLQRCQQPAKVTELRGKAAEQKFAELGGKLVTDPDFTDRRKAVVGSHLQYTVLGAARQTSTVAVHQWTHDGPDGFHMESITGVSRPDRIPGGPTGMFVNLHDVGSTTIPLSKVGTYTTKAWVRAGVDNGGVFEGYDLHIDHSVEVTHLLRATHEAHGKLGKDPDSLQKFHDTMDAQTALLRPGGPEQQNREHQFQIATTAPNPAPVGTGPLPFSAQDTRADRTKPLTYHWYVSPQTKDKPPETLGGKSMVTAGGRTGYDFGAGPSIAMPGEHAGFWVIWYQAKDDTGADAGEASYLQTILAGSDMKALAKHDKYMQTLDELGGKLEGEQVPVRGVHVSSASGAATQLRMFVGRKKGEPSTFLLIDVTPGLDPKSNRFEYTSSSGDGAIREFLSNNKYPKGMFRFHAASNQLGIDGHEHQKETDGQGTFDRISSNLSWGGMAALGVGILAAPFTRGQSLQVALVISGGLTAAGAAVSLYDRLQNAEVSGTGVALDVVTIASSLLNAGGAVRALQGPGVLLANRATKFLLWSNFAAEGVSALLIGAEGAQQIAEIINNDAMRPEQKRAAMVRVVTNLIMTSALLAVSVGQLRETRANMEATFGKVLAGKLGDEICMTLSVLDSATLTGLKTAGEQDLRKLAGALRERPALMNMVKGESRLATMLTWMTDGTGDELHFAILRAQAHDAGATIANTERLIAVLKSVSVAPETAAAWGNKALANLADPNTLAELEAILPQVQRGQIRGLEDWLTFSAAKAGDDAARTVGELREAGRRARENPRSKIDVGGDARAPLDPKSGKKAPSFDITVDDGAGTRTNVEVTSIEAPVEAGGDMITGVGHAADKARDRNLVGMPIRGNCDATIRITLAKTLPQGNRGTIEIAPNGDRVRITMQTPPQSMTMKNIFDEFGERISKSPNHMLLGNVTVVDAATGKLLAAFERTGTTWTRSH